VRRRMYSWLEAKFVFNVQLRSENASKLTDIMSKYRAMYWANPATPSPMIIKNLWTSAADRTKYATVRLSADLRDGWFDDDDDDWNEFWNRKLPTAPRFEASQLMVSQRQGRWTIFNFILFAVDQYSSKKEYMKKRQKRITKNKNK